MQQLEPKWQCHVSKVTHCMLPYECNVHDKAHRDGPHQISVFDTIDHLVSDIGGEGHEAPPIYAVLQNRRQWLVGLFILSFRIG